MKPRLLLAISASSCALFAAGCAQQMVTNGMNAMLGQPISTAFAVLGYPDGKQQFGSEDIFIWQRSHSGGMMIPQVATSYQNVSPNSMFGTVGSTPFYATTMGQSMATTTTYNQFMPMNAHFLLKVAADRKSGRIVNWEASGNDMGAAPFARSLNQYYRSTRLR